MRAVEALLLFANLLTFVILSVRPPRRARWLRLSAFIALTTAFAHALVEGPRWQMLPAYALTTTFLVIAIRSVDASTGVATGWSAASRIAVGFGALGLTLAVALPVMLPVFRFAHPTGRYAIGTLAYHWIDAGRSELFSQDSDRPRQLMVQVWYPAKASPSAPRAAYLADAGAVMASFARLQGMPAFFFAHFRYVTTHAVAAAPAAGDQSSYPVLLFLEGATGFRQMNTYQVEDLVSHGYIVAAIDQPGAAANVVFPDGHQSPGMNLAQFQSTVRPSYMADRLDSAQRGVTLPNGRPFAERSIVPYLTKDALFALDQLVALNRSDPNAILTGKLDMQRVGAFGVSLGGIVVGEACRLEPRLRACLMMDAPMSTDVVKAGLRQPSMWITRDTASMRLERQRAGGWPEAEIEAHQTSMRAVFERLPGAGYFVQVQGMFHSNFTDIAKWSPLASRWGLAGPIDGQRAHDIVNAYSRAFFDRHLKGHIAELLDGPAAQYPEATLASRRP